jgi:hypothetical protein
MATLPQLESPGAGYSAERHSDMRLANMEGKCCILANVAALEFHRRPGSLVFVRAWPKYTGSHSPISSSATPMMTSRMVQFSRVSYVLTFPADSANTQRRTFSVCASSATSDSTITNCGMRKKTLNQSCGVQVGHSVEE